MSRTPDPAHQGRHAGEPDRPEPAETPDSALNEAKPGVSPDRREPESSGRSTSTPSTTPSGPQTR